MREYGKNEKPVGERPIPPPEPPATPPSAISQIVPSLHRVPTKVPEYRRGLLRILYTMSFTELASKLKVPEDWLLAVLKREPDDESPLPKLE